MSSQPETRGGRRLRENIRWGWGWSRWFAGVLTAYAVSVALFQRSFRPGRTLWLALAAYWTAALVCAVILGFLRPFAARGRFGAFVSAALVAFVGYAVLGIVTAGAHDWVFWAAAVGGLAMGGLGVVTHDGTDMLATPSTARLAIYTIVLVAALLLLVLDMRFGIVNR